MNAPIVNLADQFSSYSRWRSGAADAVARLRNWLTRNEVGDVQADLRLQYLLERLRDDKLTVAFVAEFSRGKSELINAIFFANYRDRILPSSAGRTTMCPTELQWTRDAQPEVRLLPIRTRALRAPVSELKRFADEWHVFPLRSLEATELQVALARVGDTERVTQAEAVQLGFRIDPKGETGLKPGSDDKVEIPSWRHAVVQFPHPLLEQGLVVLDTPGLNAIGAEPELTLSLLPNAHAVLFILAADTGVTQSDLAVWREYVHPGQASRKGRLVVLNKIDGLWDGLRDDEQIGEEIDSQVRAVSDTLEIDRATVFPVSAQKGLVARVNDDAALLARSRLPELERALTEDLLPTKQDIVRDDTLGETRDVARQTRVLLEARLSGLREQLQELTDLRGKNQSVIEYMMRKIRTEKDEFEQGLQKYYAVRSVFSDLTNSLFAHIGMDALRDETRRTREAMLDSTFTRGLRDAMEGFFTHLRDNLRRSTDEIGEITRMLDAMYRRFAIEHGLKLFSGRLLDAALRKGNRPPGSGLQPPDQHRADPRHHREACADAEVLRNHRGAGATDLRGGQSRHRTMAARGDVTAGDAGARVPDPAQAPARERQAHPPGHRHAGRPRRGAETGRRGSAGADRRARRAGGGHPCGAGRRRERGPAAGPCGLSAWRSSRVSRKSERPAIAGLSSSGGACRGVRPCRSA